jgi:hypothetical protein
MLSKVYFRETVLDHQFDEVAYAVDIENILGFIAHAEITLGKLASRISISLRQSGAMTSPAFSLVLAALGRA